MLLGCSQCQCGTLLAIRFSKQFYELGRSEVSISLNKNLREDFYFPESY